MLDAQAIEFYKTWDRFGALSNFSPNPIMMPESSPSSNGSSPADAPVRRWQTLEHYYQAQKFAGYPSWPCSTLPWRGDWLKRGSVQAPIADTVSNISIIFLQAQAPQLSSRSYLETCTVVMLIVSIYVSPSGCSVVRPLSFYSQPCRREGSRGQAADGGNHGSC